MKSLRIILIGILCLTYSRTYSQSFEWNGTSFFDNNVSNLVSYIDFGDVSLNGYLEVSLTSSYSHQNATGLYRKTFNIGYQPTISFYSNSSEVTSAFGSVAEQWKLGDFEVNSSNHLVLPIYHLVSTQNLLQIHIKGTCVPTVNTGMITIIAPVVLSNIKTRDYNYIKGRLSVGTEKADVDALLTVAGNINSRELKVKVNAGADFVFDKNIRYPI